MKSLFLLIFTISLFHFPLDGQVAKKMMFEEFTGASCGPCAQQNPIYNALVDKNYDKLSSIKFQINIPSSDPMYDNLPKEYKDLVQDEWKRSGGSGVPTLIINSVLPDSEFAEGKGDWGPNAYDGAPAALTQGVIDYLAEQTSPISIAIENAEVKSEAGEFVASVDIRIKNETSEDVDLSGYNLNVYLTEKEIVFPTPAGSNGEKEFFDVFRMNLTASGGEEIASTLAAGEEKVLSYSKKVHDEVYNLGDEYLGCVAYVRNISKKDIMQSENGLFDVSIDLPNAALKGVSNEQSTDYCDDKVEITTIELENKGEIEITELTLGIYDAEGESIGEVTYNEKIAPGATATIQSPFSGELDSVDILVYTVEISSVNGGRDAILSDNLSPALFSEINYSKVPFTKGEAMNGFEEQEGYVQKDRCLVYSPVTDISIPGLNSYFVVKKNFMDQIASIFKTYYQANIDPVPSKLGANGESEGVLFFVFPLFNPPNNSFEVILGNHKVDVPEDKEMFVEFDIAHQEISGEPPLKAEVFISTDCGNKWESVYKEDASEFASDVVDELSSLFVPQNDQWIHKSININQYKDEENILVKLVLTSGSKGNNFVYIDNLNIRVSGKVSSNELTSIEAFEVYPNPASNAVTVTLNNVEGNSYDINLLDITGRHLMSVADNVSSVGHATYDVQLGDISSGLYIVEVITSQGKITKKLNIVK